jgi:tRNA pseudouridine38-40 synthase
MNSRTLKLTIAYDGTDYAGWQAQDNGPSIQVEIERAIQEVTGETLRIQGSGRTDAGVHAAGQTASLVTESSVPTSKFPLALSAHLPEDIAVSDALEMPEGFHARKSASGKIYRYSIHNGPVRPVRERRYAAHVSQELDLDAMATAAASLIGKHDFSAFVTALSERKGHCVRTIRRLDVVREGNLMLLDVEGDGFLYNMVRAIAGSLLEIGRRRFPADWLGEVLESRDRKRAGPTAPARGLCLMEVLY